MTAPNYLAGRTRAQQQWIADNMPDPANNARAAEVFEPLVPQREIDRAGFRPPPRLIGLALLAWALAVVGGTALVIRWLA